MIVPIILFVFGLAFGSFFNVIIARYDGERVLADPRVINGRSHCPHCHHTLSAIELVPVLSFLVLGGRCRHCHAKISWQYPIIELLTGFIFALVPLCVASLYSGAPQFIALLAVLWILVFSALLIMSVIDLRLGIIPDELSVFLLLLGLGIVVANIDIGGAHFSFLGDAAAGLGFAVPVWFNYLFGAIVGGGLFGGLWALTRGRGMGFGDVKLAVPLGLFFGWPDIFCISILAFIIGAAVGIGTILFGGKTMKSSLPFGPFLAVSAAIIFFFGAALLRGYLGLMGL